MLKKIIIAALLLSTALSQSVSAQTDVGASPVLLLVPALSASVEQGINDFWGVEGNLFAAEGGLLLTVAGKHYLSPKRGADRFNIGLFLGGASELGAGGGFLFGYKAVSEKNLLFDIGLGVGRTIGGEGIIPYFKINFGYRFGGDETGELP